MTLRNDELFSPDCPDDHAKKLVVNYALRGLVDGRGTYSPDKLLARQHAVFLEWLAAVHEHQSTFSCGFYEWLCRGCDSAFVFRPGDLVEFGGRYCVVVRRRTREVTWVNSWRIRCGMPVQDSWPQPVTMVELKDADGRVSIPDALCESIAPADIPPEIFALACGKAKDCPMMKGGCE